MTHNEIHDLAKQTSLKIIQWVLADKSVRKMQPDFVTNIITGLLTQMQRKIEQAEEDGELLAYKCEKRAKEKIIGIVEKYVTNDVLEQIKKETDA